MPAAPPSHAPLKHFSLFKENKALPILWENNHYALLQKPSSLPSHPTRQEKKSVETALTPLKRGGPWLVHRLDRDTSGCLLIAKRKNALIKAQNAFASSSNGESKTRPLQKIYWALLDGKMQQTRGEITTPIRRVTSDRSWKMQTCQENDQNAEKAHSSWRVLGETSFQNRFISWVELTLHTGRTHQARIHCASLGCPILGDKIYHPHKGSSLAGFPNLPLQLLARSLRLTLDEIEIYGESTPEKEMTELLSLFEETTLLDPSTSS